MERIRVVVSETKQENFTNAKVFDGRLRDDSLVLKNSKDEVIAIFAPYSWMYWVKETF
jgi:hypothetical protein